MPRPELRCFGDRLTKHNASTRYGLPRGRLDNGKGRVGTGLAVKQCSVPALVLFSPHGYTIDANFYENYSPPFRPKTSARRFRSKIPLPASSARSKQLTTVRFEPKWRKNSKFHPWFSKRMIRPPRLLFSYAKKRFEQFLLISWFASWRSRVRLEALKGECEILVLAGNKNKHGHSWHL